MSLRALCMVCVWGAGLGAAPAAAWENPVEPAADIDVEPILERLGSGVDAVFRDGDTLTFVTRSSAAEAKLTSWFPVPFEPHGRGDVYVGRVTIPGAERLLMSYAFTENDDKAWPHMREFRGPEAPALLPSATPITGRHVRHLLDSQHLENSRQVDVYVPPHDGGPLPVVYMTDGRALDSYVEALDWAIRSDRFDPVIVVGVHSGGYVGDRSRKMVAEFDYRALEYLAGLASERYDMHNRFLIDEVMPFVEATYGASSERDQRVLTGYSNGGAHAVTFAVDHPGVVGTVLPYSVAFFSRGALRDALASHDDLPRFRFAAGELERFVVGTRDAHEIVAEANADATIRTYLSGHDPLMWRVALFEDLSELF